MKTTFSWRHYKSLGIFLAALISMLAVYGLFSFLVTHPPTPTPISASLPTVPKRIVSLSPNLTEMLFFLGAENRLVGVTTRCNYPPEAGKIRKVGDFGAPDLERIIALKPDLIIATSFENHPISLRFKELKLPYINYSAHKLADISDILLNLSAILANDSKNTAVSWKNSLISLQKEQIKGSIPSIYIKLWPNSLMTAANNTFMDEIISLSGGKNIAHDLKGEYPELNIEFLLKQDPDIIIIAYPLDQKELKSIKGWDSLKAVKNGQVYGNFDPDILLRPGPRVLEGIAKIKEIIKSQEK
ncbi:MAG: cobalamin-binding protein [Candidatus Margulisiibacteriota bacterium]|jgi:iron complex transport system substrate-binding protein